jgi:uncharacterized RDD family membrane protein YckC
MENRESLLSDIENAEIEVSYFQRVVGSLIDLVIEIITVVIIAFLFSKMFQGFLSVNSYATYLIVFAIMFTNRFLCINLFGRTIGMIVVRIKYLNANLQPLSIKEKLLAVFSIRTSAIKKYRQS